MNKNSIIKTWSALTDDSDKANDEILPMPFIPLTINKNSFNSFLYYLAPMMSNSHNFSSLIIIIESEKVKYCVLIHWDYDNLKFKTPIIIDNPKKTGELTKILAPIINCMGGSSEISDIDKKYEKIDDWIKKENNVDIGNLQIVSSSSITSLKDIYDGEINGTTSKNIIKIIGQYLDIIIAHNKKNELFCYPSSPIYDFAKNLQTLFGGISFSKIFAFITQLFPKKRFTVSLYDENLLLSYKIMIDSGKFFANFIDIPQYIVNEKNQIKQHKMLLKHNLKVFRTKDNYIFNLSTNINWILDLFQSPLPISTERGELLEEKLLYRYKSLGKYWDHYPHSFITLPFVRYLMFLFGFRINAQKLSYWALPKLLNYFVKTSFGLNDSLLFIIDNIPKNPILKNSTLFTIVERENGAIHKINHVDFPTENFNGELDEIKDKVNEIYADNEKIPYISHLIWIDAKLLEKSINTLIFKINGRGFGFMKILSIISKLKNKKYLKIEPKPPIYEYLKSINMLNLIKIMGNIITDIYEY